MNKERFYKDEYVCHKKFPEEYGLGIVLEALPDNQYKVEWRDEFGNVEVSEHDGGDLE